MLFFKVPILHFSHSFLKYILIINISSSKQVQMRSIITTLLFVCFLIVSTSLCLATRPEPESAKENGPNTGSGVGGFFGPGNGFNIPGWGNGFGYGSGSPNGGYHKNGVNRQSTVCQEKGPCYKKKVMCPAKCYTSYSHSGKGGGGGGGGGGCSVDCKKNCVASCVKF